jgi:hypothetical protein
MIKYAPRADGPQVVINRYEGLRATVRIDFGDMAGGPDHERH